MADSDSDETTSEISRLDELAAAVDTFYLLFCGALVFFMQAGFGSEFPPTPPPPPVRLKQPESYVCHCAVLEAGAVRSKNAKNILLKNMLDACIGAAIWWSVGYGIAV
jgi:Amt family ammonium transporter